MMKVQVPVIDKCLLKKTVMEDRSLEKYVSNSTAILDNCLDSRWRSRFLLVLSGALYPFAFSPFEIWPLAYLSVLILLYALVRAAKQNPVVLSGFKIGFFWGLGAFLFGASWVYVSVHQFGYVPAAGAAILTLLFVMLIALFKALFGYLCVKLIQYCRLRFFVISAPFCWLISEYIQSTAFSGFPWLLFGYSQVDSPLSSISTWFGVYGVSWFSIAITACLVLLLSEKRRNKLWLALLILLSFVFTATLYDTYTTKVTSAGEKLDIALIQPNILQDQKWDYQYFSRILDVLFAETKNVWDADIIVWPEGAIPAYSHQVRRILSAIEDKMKASDANLLVGIPEYDEATERSYVALKSLGQRSYTYYKQVLVPFGEYVPFEQWLRGVIRFLDLPMSSFTEADFSQEAIALAKVTLIPAICYEVVYPSIIYDLFSSAPIDKPQLIVTVSNDAWFGGSLGPYQHMQMARMRAAELGVPLIRSTNDGITAIVDASGNVVEQLPRYKQAHLRHILPIENRATLYRLWGLKGISVIVCVSGIFLFFSWLTSVRDKQN